MGDEQGCRHFVVSETAPPRSEVYCHAHQLRHIHMGEANSA